MLKIIYHPADQATANLLIRDFTAAGTRPQDLTTGGALEKGDTLVAVISPASTAEKGGAVESAYTQALDLFVPVIPVIIGSAALPKLIDHLKAADLSAEYEFAPVKAIHDEVTAPGAKMPLKVRTPAVKRSNRQAGIIVGAAAIVMFLVGLYGIGVLGIQAPVEEYREIDLQVTQTIQALIAPPLATLEGYLPQNAEEAFVYPATLLAAPTRYRPFAAGTATAQATISGIYPATATPTPSS